MRGRVVVVTPAQSKRHERFVVSLHSRSGRYSPFARSSDGGAGRRRHRSQRVGGKGK